MTTQASTRKHTVCSMFYSNVTWYIILEQWEAMWNVSLTRFLKYFRLLLLQVLVKSTPSSSDV